MKTICENHFKKILDSINEIQLQSYREASIVKERGEQEINLFDEVYLSFAIDCYAQMEIIDNEEEQGLNTGWYLPENHNIQINQLFNITIWIDDDTEAYLTEEQENQLEKKIINNLKFNTTLS